MKNPKNLLRLCLGILFMIVSVQCSLSQRVLFTTNTSTESIFSGETASRSTLADTIYTTICNNQMPYDWNGITCLTPGTYSVTLVSTTGADSIVTLNLSVINVGTSITNAIICNNELPYTWNGNSYTINGTYSVTLTSTTGCDSVPILSLTVNDVVTSTSIRTVCANQLPYSWNGSNYPGTGIYAVVLTSAAGCDSIASLDLTVKPVAFSTTNRAICISQFPYSWNGNSYFSAGTYADTLTGSNGCDSIATLNLTVNSTVTSTTIRTVCSNQLPYTWNGNSYVAAGSYSVMLASASGCDSIATLILTVRPVATSTTNVTICTAQLPYSWNGNSYPAAGLYLVTLTGISGCDSIAKLRLTVVPFLTSTTIRIICSTQLPYSWSGNIYTSGGTYTASFTTAAGCDSFATLRLFVNNPVVMTTTLIICDNQLPFNWHGVVYTAAGVYPLNPPVIISACNSVDTLILIVQPVVPSTTTIRVCSNQVPYTWNGNNYPGPGTYTVTLTSSSGCDSLAGLNLMVIPIGTSTTNTTVCSNHLPFIWNGNDYYSSGTYTATLISANQCDSIATLNLTVNPVRTSTTVTRICTAQLPYTWNGNSYTGAGTFTVTLTSAGGCDSLATLDLEVVSYLSSTTNVTVCNDQLPYSWNGNSYSASGTYSITLVNNMGCDSIATLNLSANPVIPFAEVVDICTTQLPFNWNGNNYSVTGTYPVTLIGSGGCDSVAILNLNVHTIGTSVTSTAICNNQLPYSWNGNSYPVAGVYPVTLTGSSGCDSIAVLNLVVTDVLTSTTNVVLCNSQLPYQWNGNYYSAGGTYSVTLTTPNGCDSVPILSLTIIQYLTSTTNMVICNDLLPYSWNGNSYSGSGTYTVLLNATSGCDSIATLNLSVRPSVTSVADVIICANQLPYNWNGNSYPASGTYLLTLTATNGCDSLVTLNLVANAMDTGISDITVCYNQLPYSWNGNSYPGAGTYSVTLTGTSGCDSIAILNLITNPVLTGIINIAICNNQLPYSWNGNSYSIAGTYTDTLTTTSGCDSIATLNLTTNAAVTSSTDITICNNQLPHNWNGNSYSTAGTYADTLTSVSGCDSIATLNLAINAPVTSTTDIIICNNQLPYNWNGNSYSIAGTYADTLTTSSGCDSIATLNLATNAAVTSTTDITICNNQLPYNWNGNNYSTAGTYADTLTTSSGCDSIATLNLATNAAVTSTTDITICNNQLPYNWNGNNYSTGGSYLVVLIGSAGCDSIATLVLTIHSVSTSATSITICSNQLPYTWNGQNFSTGGIHVLTLVNGAGCDSTATLNLIVNPVVSSNSNASVCSNQLPFSWNGQSYTIAGIHTVTLVSAEGCDSVATLNLVINPVQASITNAGTCTNQLPYSWNGQNYSAGGNFSVTLTSSAGCDSVATLFLTVNPVTASITNANICSAQLPYSWNGQNYTTAGPHIITLTSSAGCDSITTLNLTINPTPALPAVASPVIYCQYETTMALGANMTTPGSHLLWYSSPLGGTGALTAPVPSSAIAGSINYYVSQVSGSCEGPRALITVKVNSKPYLGPDKPVKICFGTSVNLGTLYNTSGYTSSWHLGQLTVQNVSEVTIPGIYQLVVQNSSGCSDTAMVNLAIQPPVIAYAGDDDNAEYNMPYQLSGSGGGQYQWSPGQLLNNPFIQNPLATLTTDATFVLMVKDDIGCIAFDTVKLRVLKGPTFYVPTAFTPNSDGLNDVFRPTSVGIDKLEFFRVFNRFGELIFETHEIGKGWDGRFKGINQNGGNYVWSLKGTDRKGITKTMKGNVVLIR